MRVLTKRKKGRTMITVKEQRELNSILNLSISNKEKMQSIRQLLVRYGIWSDNQKYLKSILQMNPHNTVKTIIELQN